MSLWYRLPLFLLGLFAYVLILHCDLFVEFLRIPDILNTNNTNRNAILLAILIDVVDVWVQVSQTHVQSKRLIDNQDCFQWRIRGGGGGVVEGVATCFDCKYLFNHYRQIRRPDFSRILGYSLIFFRHTLTFFF